MKTFEILLQHDYITIVVLLDTVRVKSGILFPGYYMKLPTTNRWYIFNLSGASLTKIVGAKKKEVLDNMVSVV